MGKKLTCKNKSLNVTKAFRVPKIEALCMINFKKYPLVRGKISSLTELTVEINNEEFIYSLKKLTIQ